MNTCVVRYFTPTDRVWEYPGKSLCIDAGQLLQCLLQGAFANEKRHEDMTLEVSQACTVLPWKGSTPAKEKHEIDIAKSLEEYDRQSHPVKDRLHQKLLNFIM